jgi:hypothetical protein
MSAGYLQQVQVNQISWVDKLVSRCNKRISSNFFGGAIKATNAIISNFINALSIRNKCIFSNSS